MSASMNEIEDFLNGALVSWLESCLPHPEILSGYPSLLDGTIFHIVWRQIDPEPQFHPIKLSANMDEASLANARAKNFDIIVRNLKTLYEEELNQTLLVVPDCLTIGHTPETRAGLEQMKLLLILLLGAAVQCPNKQIFIARIKELDFDIQHSIVELIKQVTDTQSLVLNVDGIENFPSNQMYDHLIRIARERDKYHSNWISSLGAVEQTEGKSAGASTTSSGVSTDQNHMAVELADQKAKLRKFRQELEEKTEAYIEVKEELDHKAHQYEKLRTESQEWYTDSRRAAAYRDEVDVLRERAERADRLEIEIQRLREKLSDAEFFKTRVEELREDNRMLSETKEMLEEQLARSRKRSEHAMALESEIIKYKQKLNDMALERDADKTKLQELLDENTHLQLATRTLHSASDFERIKDEIEDECASGDNSLSEQLTNNAQTRAIKLELENKRLQQALDALNESNFHESAGKLLDLEKEKKKLSLKVEQLQENCQRFTQQNHELETMFKNALEENKKLQDSIDNRQQATEKQQQDRELDRMKLIDLEKHVEALTKEKQRIQTLSDSIQRRADDLERFLDTKNKELEDLKPKAMASDHFEKEVLELKNRVNSMERENGNLQKDIFKFKQTVETKDVQLDENTTKLSAQTIEIQNLQKQVEIAAVETARTHEIESKNNEFVTQCKIYEETISTLQKDLIEKTLAVEKVRKELEKLCVVGALSADDSLSNVDLSVENVADKLIRNAETMRIVREALLSYAAENAGEDSGSTCFLCNKTGEKDAELSADGAADLMNETEAVLSSVSAQWKEQCDQLAAENTDLQSQNEMLQSEIARQKVDVSTLGSQVTSLNTQYVALQLANSQLASEKDAAVKALEAFKEQHDSLLNDQHTFQALHEQLSSEYEGLNHEKETLKATLRDLRNENRDSRDREVTLQNKIAELQMSMDATKRENEILCNLRTEHSKLKDDFRNLFTTSERLKHEYKSIQEQYKILRTDNSRLNLQSTELTGELALRIDQNKSLEIELSKEANRCEMLVQMNSNLDVDRRALMEHVSQLLSQYHELLAHSLDDKQHYHDEEKLFTDKLNNLYRQKEKLEEKIMEHYRKLDSCSSKKKPFGSSFMKKAIKAGSGLINKVPSRNRRTWTDDSRLTQSQFNLGSESGGNESDNSVEETNLIGSDSNLLKKTSHSAKQSLQRKSTDRLDNSLLNRTLGAKSGSYQPLIREESIRSHRNSVQGLEPPDVTESSLRLGTAGSRRTVYLVDENPKLADGQTAEAPPATAMSNAEQSPSTYLMYNRISNVIGTIQSEENNGEAAAASAQDLGAFSDTANGSRKKNEEKESAVWYEYGCV